MVYYKPCMIHFSYKYHHRSNMRTSPTTRVFFTFDAFSSIVVAKLALLAFVKVRVNSRNINFARHSTRRIFSCYFFVALCPSYNDDAVVNVNYLSVWYTSESKKRRGKARSRLTACTLCPEEVSKVKLS